MRADLFVSYARADRDQVLPWVERLQAQGISVWMDQRDLEGASLWSQEIVEAIESCTLLLLIVSPASVVSTNVLKEVSLAGEANKPILPLLLEPVQIPTALRYHLVGIQKIELYDGEPEKKLESIVRSIQRCGIRTHQPSEPREGKSLDSLAAEGSPDLRQKKAELSQSSGEPSHGPVRSVAPRREPADATLQVVLLYKRHARADERLLQLLEAELQKTGHQVFIDRHLQIGAEWLQEIEQQVSAADAVIVLLSAASVESEMLAYELQIARDAARRQNGKPRLLPVRVSYREPFPEPLAVILNPLQYFSWEGPKDDERLVSALLAALEAPPALPVAIPREKLRPAGGVVPLDAPYYVVRPTDHEFHTAIARRDGIVLLKGARQMGKTSLLARGLQQAREAGAQILRTDFQMLDEADLETMEGLFQTLGEWIADQLELDVSPTDVWKPRLGAGVNFTRFLRREVLGRTSEPIVWALDEVDRLFGRSYGSQVFGLFRAWYNERELDRSGPWSRLSLAIAYATEAHLFISDLNQSPFNVGTRLSLEDFTFEQVAELNRRYGSPLNERAEIDRFYRLVGGHPYLTHRGIHEMATRDVSFAAFEVQADRDEGIFGDHLRRILVLLFKDPELCRVVQGVLHGEPCPTEASFYRLRGAGVIAGESARHVRPRCQLYSTYLERHLL